MNKVMLIGRITKDLELRNTKGGKSVCSFSIAINRIGAKEEQQQADFVNVMVWNTQAENLCKYQSKGSLIAVTGSIRVDKYESEGQTKYKTYILANEIEFLDSKKSSDNSEVNTAIDTNKNSEEIVNDPFAEFGDEITLDENDLPF